MNAQKTYHEFARSEPFFPQLVRQSVVQFMRAKELYREFSMSEPTLPVFSRAWWLDATAGPAGWDVALVRKGDEVLAAMPYAIRKRYGFKALTQPALTQKLGPWFRSTHGKPATRLAREKELMQALIDQLPPFDHFSQLWHYDRTNWMPFCWNSFQQTTRYSYVLKDLSNLDKLWAGLQHNTRGECKKATERHHLQVRDDLPLDMFLDLNRMTFARQGVSVPYSDAFVHRMDAACIEHGCRKILIATGKDGRAHAGLYMVWDEQSAYGLMAGSNPALRSSGAMSLCFWEAIRHAARVAPSFDFGGSMRQGVECFFRGFGASQLPYFSISKTPSRLLRLQQGLRSAFGRT